jgi:hypothetical protein
MTSRVFPLFILTSTIFAAPPEPKFKAVTIDDKIQIGYGLAIADVDGDGKPDILLADKKQYVWYRNPGTDKATDPAAWSKFVIAENLTVQDNVCLAAQDLDGDGKCELAVGAEWNPADTEKSGAVFYLIPPADRTQRWEPVKFPSVEPTTHRMKWVKLNEKDWGLVVVPLHGRGNKNGEGAPVKVLCYHKPADVRGEWPAEVVDESMHMTHNFDVVPSDGHVPGIMLGGKEGVTTARWNKTWEKLGLCPGSGETGEVRGNWSGRGNFFVTVEPMHGNALVLHPFIDPSKRHVLTDQLTEGHALACADLLGTGSEEVVVGWRGNAKQPKPVGIKLFTRMDDKGEQWRESLVDDNEMACEDLVLADLNGDGKLDVVASGRATKNVKIYLNETAQP